MAPRIVSYFYVMLRCHEIIIMVASICKQFLNKMVASIVG